MRGLCIYIDSEIGPDKTDHHHVLQSKSVLLMPGGLRSEFLGMNSILVWGTFLGVLAGGFGDAVVLCRALLRPVAENKLQQTRVVPRQ